ncbi:MBL fold metallo-hydrolase [Runella sp.]|jgi:metallo-beta-lactamase family protein|uniref:MBL fold metallo-hydrolase RNA specificity domain-containing protein n=1 Tax=Runella sp. TaxID=1960881 RepID=UPI002630257B|nr:MBL fold metallo-hydrolase [Runella sp.]
MKLTFWGAAQQVTGSMYLLELDGDYRILIDCGSDFESGKRALKENTPFPTALFPFEASGINLVLLTHAHIDHSGNIPNLYRDGYEGQVLCTDSTYALTAILLKDAAMLNQKRLNEINSANAQRKRKKGKKKDLPKDLYLEKQVREALENFVPLAFNRRFRVADNCVVTFIPAGHLLGAAHIMIEVWEEGKKKTIGFSGDIGRKGYPLLLDPGQLPQVDYLICETTYGNRVHEKGSTPELALADVIRRTCVDIPGRLIIPSFSIGRTQALLYTLNKLYNDHNLPPIKVFADSPLAMESSKVYQRNVRMLNREAREFNEDNESLFDFENLIYLESSDASRAVSNHAEPCIIISSSGMVQGGRVEYHVAQNISNPYCTILMIGYCAEGTLGWRLLNGQTTLRIRGKEEQVLANIEKIDVFSGHGDQEDLVAFVRQQSPEQLKQIFLVHGEKPSMDSFKNTLESVGYDNIEIPEKGQTFEL